MQQGSLTVPDTPPAMNRQETVARACEVPSARAGLLTGTSAPDFAFPNRADSSRREGQSAGGGAALSGQFSGVTDVRLHAYSCGGSSISCRQACGAPLQPAIAVPDCLQHGCGRTRVNGAGGWRTAHVRTGFPEWPGSGRADDGPRVTPARRLSGPVGSGVGLCSSRRRTTPPENRAGDWRNQSGASIERRTRVRQTHGAYL